MSSGTFTGGAGTRPYLGGQGLTAASTISSDGSVGINGSTEAGSYSAAGGTAAYDSSFTGTVVDLGSSLSVSGTVSFAPAMGGPVTLTTGTLSVGGELTGTDSFVADGLLTLDRFSTLSFTGSMDAYGGIAMIEIRSPSTALCSIITARRPGTQAPAGARAWCSRQGR